MKKRKFVPVVMNLENRELMAVVAILGSGVDASVLPAGRVMLGYNALDFTVPHPTPVNTVPQVKTPFAYHSTALASIVLRDAPNSLILPIIVSDTNDKIEMNDVARGISLAWRNGAQVILIGIGSTEFDGTLVASESVADFRGHAMIIAAAGDFGINIDQSPVWPAADNFLTNVVSVAAIDDSGRLLPNSDFGRRDVDLAAPGLRQLVTLPGGNIDNLSGTAFAAAHVAAVMSRIVDAFPNGTTLQWRQMIQGIATSMPSLNGMTYTNGAIMDPARVPLISRPVRPSPTFPGESAFPFNNVILTPRVGRFPAVPARFVLANWGDRFRIWNRFPQRRMRPPATPVLPMRGIL